MVIADTDGPPDTTHAPVGCGQSHANYPKLLAGELGITNFRDATCGGAESDDFYAPQSVEPGGTNPAQFDRLTPTTDLVTVGIGGNDAGIAGAATDCFGVFADDQTAPPATMPEQVPQGGCKDEYAPEGGEDQLARQILEAEPKVVTALEEIHRRSPDARVLIIDYFAAVPEHACYPMVPISREDMVYLHATMLRLNAMVQRAAVAGGAEFVDSYAPRSATTSASRRTCGTPRSTVRERPGWPCRGGSIAPPELLSGVPATPLTDQELAMASSQFTITTERLELGPWTPEDASAGLTIFGNDDVTRWLAPAMEPIHDEAEMRATLERWAREEADADPPVGHWAVRRGEDQAVIGSITLRRMPPFDEDLELAWQFSPSHWGNGYATEAARGVATWAFERSAHELFAVMRQANDRAEKLARRLGMQWVGETDKYYDLRLQVYRLRPPDLVA